MKTPSNVAWFNAQPERFNLTDRITCERLYYPNPDAMTPLAGVYYMNLARKLLKQNLRLERIIQQQHARIKQLRKCY